MSTPDRVLFVTYCFPPDAAVGGKRPARFCRYLPEFGFAPIVLTIEERFYEVIDRSYPIPGGVELIRTPVLRTPIDLYREWAKRREQKASASEPESKPLNARAATSEAPSVSARSFRAHLNALDMPNENWGWYWYAVDAGKRILREGGVSAIVSTAPPWTCHLIARALKREFRVPWIADFRDPWTFEPWRAQVPAWRDRLDNALEARIVRDADRVVTVVDGVRDEFRRKYSNEPAEKFLTISNGYEGENEYSHAATPQHPRVLLHLGTLYGYRRIDGFCAALSNLVEHGKVNAGDVHVLCVGPVSADIHSQAVAAAPKLIQDGVLEFRPSVPFEEGQRLLRTADVLLLFQGGHKYSVTAKLYEYFAAGKWILAITSSGAISNLLADTGLGFCADPQDVAGIESALLHCLEMPAQLPPDRQEVLRRFHFRNLSKRLAEVLREVSGRQAAGAVGGRDSTH